MSDIMDRLAIAILNVLSMADRETGMYSLTIAVAVDRPTGTIHPVLAVLEREGLIETRWENETFPSDGGKVLYLHDKNHPRRRFYRLAPGPGQKNGALVTV